MLQSQIINVLPRRILAGLWATHETRISVIYKTLNKERNKHANIFYYTALSSCTRQNDNNKRNKVTQT